MSSRINCWLRGQQWGPWDRRIWENLVGVEFRVRWCRQCGARDRAAA